MMLCGVFYIGRIFVKKKKKKKYQGTTIISWYKIYYK